MKVYEYEVTKYDPHTRDGGLFADYINTFLKLKAEASGYPGWVYKPLIRGTVRQDLKW